MKKILLLPCLLVLFLVSCAVLPPTVQRFSSMDGYRYVYITPTSEKTSVTGGAVGTQYGLYGSTESHSVNPADIISGHFLKRGYVRLPEINPDLIEQTLIVNYGELGERNLGWGFSKEIIIQILSAKTNEIICVGTAEGNGGDNEAKDIQKAIDSCMNEIFNW